VSTDELQARVAELEELVGELQDQVAAIPDSLSPNYLTQDAQGRVGADFSGKLHAEGIVFDEPASSSPPDSSTVQWVRTADGTLAAELYSQDEPGNIQRTYLRAGPVDDTPVGMQHIIVLRANDDHGTDRNDFVVENARPAGAKRRVGLTMRNDADTADLQKTFFDSLGASDWAFGGSAAAPLMDGAAAAGASATAARDDHRHPTDTSRAPVAGPVHTGDVTTDGNFFSTGATKGFYNRSMQDAGQVGVGLRVSGEGNDRMTLKPDGLHLGGGAAPTDCNLVRDAAGKRFVTGQQLQGQDGLATKTKAGAPVDGDFGVTPLSGTLAVDTTNSRLYVRVGATWKSVAVA
jgi:hypothetical protein